MTIPPLSEVIDGFRAQVIASLLQTAGITDAPKSKEGKAQLWLAQLGDRERIERALAATGPRVRQALEVLQARGPETEMRTARFRALLQQAGIVTKDTQPPTRAWHAPEEARDPATFEEILAALIRYGLVLSHTPSGGTSKLGFEGGLFVFIPAEVAAHLPPVTPAPRVRPAIASVLPGSARTCQRDLYLYWSAAREAPLPLTNAGLLRVGDLKRVAGQLLVSETVETGDKENDLRRLLFLRRLLTALKALAPGSNDFTQVAAPEPAFLQAAPAPRVRTCFELWRDGAWWNELWATYRQGETRAGGSVVDFAPPQVARARRKTLDLLVRFARQDEWVSVKEIMDELQNHDEDFLVDRSSATRLNQYNYYYGSVAISPYMENDLGWEWSRYSTDETAGWEGVETAFVRAVFAEGLYWMGLVDLGYTFAAEAHGGAAPAGLAAVRLSDMGRWLLLGEAQPAIPAETGRVVVQPNFHIFAFDPIADSTLARLDGFATRLNAERAIEYEMTRESVYRSQSAGHPVSEIRAWLEEVSGAALPQNVSRSLDEWQAAFERIVVRPRMAMLQASAPELLDRLLANPAAQPAIVKRLNETTLLVAAEQVDALERALLAADELPARNLSAAAGQGGITLEPEGRVRFAGPLPSLYTAAFLQPFTDECGGEWCITPASVRRGRRRGLDAAQILAGLEPLAAGGVPAALERRIKAWAGHYGAASLRTLTLLQFRDHHALEELMEDPEIAPYLTPFMPDRRLGLASVAPEDVERVAALLVERGVDVK